uniref:RNA binding motif protein 43 n=1 Tax=Poecilia latipinna TaxID=48699 RepID=A0A3B3VU57_9TELE
MATVMADSCRTVVVSGVPAVLEFSRMVDKLIIHFQSRRRSHGGDVEVVKYPTDMGGVAFVTFDKAEGKVAAVCGGKSSHVRWRGKTILRRLVLSHFTPELLKVFLYVAGATVDLSVFGSDQASLIKSLQSAHRSIRFQASPQQRKASIEGPFSAVSALKEDLIRRASHLRPSSQTAVGKPRASSPHPRLASKNSPTSCRSTEANREAANSSNLSKSPHHTREAREVQSLISKAETPKAFLRQKVVTSPGEEPFIKELSCVSAPKRLWRPFGSTARTIFLLSGEVIRRVNKDEAFTSNVLTLAFPPLSPHYTQCNYPAPFLNVFRMHDFHDGGQKHHQAPKKGGMSDSQGCFSPRLSSLGDQTYNWTGDAFLNLRTSGVYRCLTVPIRKLASQRKYMQSGHKLDF